MNEAIRPALSVSGVAASYGKRAILDDVSFTVSPGEVLGLIGLNGAGKTTLLKSVLDLRFLDGGEISVFGEPHRDHRSRRHFAFLPEQMMPSPVLKGWEWLRLTLGPYGVVPGRSEADAACRGLALESGALDRRVTTYSKGMAQKLGLVAMFLSARPLLILDEPMSGLDPLARLRLKEHLLAYRAAGNAVFFSSHILADVAALCDRVAVLHGGRIAFLGSPAALQARHAGGGLEHAFLETIGGGTAEGAAA
jgi:ABC-2 type transport system ATP-binding protein